MTWEPIWALPNIDLDEPVDSETFALVSPSDPRIQELLGEHSIFRNFMGQFQDTFGEQIEPTLIICRTDITRSLRTIDAVASFRDLLVVSTVPLARSLGINRNIFEGVTYSNYFWVYPWMVSNDYESIIANTPAILALDEVGQFKGHSSPDLSRLMLNRRHFDEPLLQELLCRWTARYKTNSPKWEDVALFRSLNMVNQACLLPAGNDVVFHDYGRTIGLWVAAFEILVHPGGNGKANRRKVFELLHEIPWVVKKYGHHRYKMKVGKNLFERKNIACWLYDQIYSCRNDFMHGNPVDSKNLFLSVSRRELDKFTATLYRLALSAFLDLAWKEEAPPLENAQELANYCTRKWGYEQSQEDCEEALLLSRISVEEQCRMRENRKYEALEGYIRY